jgi:hypothetical protein
MERETLRNAAVPAHPRLIAGPPRKGRDGDHRVIRINGVGAASPCTCGRKASFSRSSDLLNERQHQERVETERLERRI